MKPFLSILLSLVAVGGWTQPEDAALRAQVQDHYRKWDRLVNARSWNKLFALIDPAWHMVTADNRVLTLADARRAMGSMPSTRCRIIVNSVQASGNEVTAWITQTHSYRVKRGNRWVWVSEGGRFADTLKRTPDGFQFSYTQALPNAGQWGWMKS